VREKIDRRKRGWGDDSGKFISGGEGGDVNKQGSFILQNGGQKDASGSLPAHPERGKIGSSF